MQEMVTSWNYGIVALSVITAIIGSFVALSVAEHLRMTKGIERLFWMGLGASIMGLAIWSMHFVGMLAMSMNMPMSYDPWLSFLSMIAAAVGAGLAFLILQRPTIGAVQYIFGSLAMGLAISTMHYTGMASMRMAAKIVYDPLLFTASILVAIIASVGALWLTFRPAIGSTIAILLQKVGSAVVMGLAISGMHYTGMAAAHYIHTGTASRATMFQTVGHFPLSSLLIIALVVFGVALIVLSAHAFAERQKIIEALQISEQRFLATFEQAAVGMGHIGTNGEFIRLNQKYCDIVGYPHDELIRITFQDITHPDDLEKDLGRYTQLQARQIPSYTLEKRYIRKDGTPIWVNLTVSIVWKDSGAFDYAIAVVEDISAKKHAEEALLHSQVALKEYTLKLERSNQDLEHFATITSHDLQAPLRKVIMFSEGLKATEADSLSETGKVYIARLQRATMRMQDLISDLLTLSRVNRKGSPFQPVDLNQVVAESLEELEAAIQESQGQVKVLNQLPVIEADSRQLQQVFLNLISNALKFQQPGQCPLVTLSSEIAAETCQIIVQDNGIGFEPKYAERIFGAFERLHSHEQYPGTGVGLAIVQKIIERHHGQITAMGEPNQGATFVLTLPVSQKQFMDLEKLESTVISQTNLSE
jgi:PAS domain S-box-containing protein